MVQIHVHIFYSENMAPYVSMKLQKENLFS